MAEVSIDQAMHIALEHHRAGRLAEAEGIYLQILQIEPNHAVALHHLGVLAHQAGNNEAAADLMSRSIAANPGEPRYHRNLAEVWRALGRLDRAAECYRSLTALWPEDADGYIEWGRALHEQGRIPDAIECYRQALRLRPGAEAALCNLGMGLQSQGRLEEAIECYQQVLARQPDHADAMNGLGNVLKELGRAEEAAGYYRKVIALRPDDAGAHTNLGSALEDLGRSLEAMECHRRALALNPRLAQAHCNLGAALAAMSRPGEAAECCLRALALEPQFPAAYINLGQCLHDQGRATEAIACYRKVMELRPEDAEIHSSLLMAMHYPSGVAAQEIYEEHLSWARRHAQPRRPQGRPHENDRDPHRRLRIGYVSPDFRDHAVAAFFEPVLAAHDHSGFEIVCYSAVRRADAVTERLRQCADRWVGIERVSDDRVAEQIREDGIDILVDLAGHTRGNRLLVFARKPAPVQVTWLGYPDTSGLATMDYRLTDAQADPRGMTERYHTEQLIRLPEGFLCYLPPEPCPEVASSPATGLGHITFGSFNNLAKVTGQVVEAWAAVLSAVPGSHMILKARGLDDPGIGQRVRDGFAARGIAGERVELLGPTQSLAEQLGTYARVDIALDTFPYNGTTTTCEAMWMGVPVVTLAGQSHVSRVGASLLSNVGLSWLIANNVEEYVRIAVGLAGDVGKLGELRSGMRERMRTSPLMDGARFTRHLEEAYRGMWAGWCASPGTRQPPS